MTVLRGFLAALAGLLAAALAGIGLDFANRQFHWVDPAYGYMYFYPWLTLAGGVLGAGLAGGLFALWNRSGAVAPHPARAVLAALNGAWWAFIAGVLFDYANGYFAWLTPAAGLPFGYALLTVAGGVLGAIVAVASYSAWHLSAPAAAGGKTAVAGKARAATTTASRPKAATSPGYTSARQQATGFADVPGMPVGDFQSALDTSKDAKAKE